MSGAGESAGRFGEHALRFEVRASGVRVRFPRRESPLLLARTSIFWFNSVSIASVFARDGVNTGRDTPASMTRAMCEMTRVAIADECDGGVAKRRGNGRARGVRPGVRARVP